MPGWNIRRSPVVGLFVGLAALGGLYFVWMPSHATRLAALVGIGRGVDLIIYIWVVISLLLLLNLHLKLRAQMELITVLARELAIANARSSPGERRVAMSQAAPAQNGPIRIRL